MVENDWPRVAVVGAGAVGCYFGGMLARAGAPVTLIGRAPHVEAINRDGLFIDSIHFKENVSVSASTELAAARDAQLVLFSVKTLDTENVAKQLAPYLAAETIVVSFQNGVDNVERIDFAAGIQAIPAVVYIAVEMVDWGGSSIQGAATLSSEICRPSTKQVNRILPKSQPRSCEPMSPVVFPKTSRPNCGKN